MTSDQRTSAAAPAEPRIHEGSEVAIAISLFAVTCIYLLAFRTVTNMDPDEGIVLQGAHRILNGQVPYRDFFSFYTPGSFYLTALLFAIFGDSLSVARTALIFFGATFPVITFVLARRTCSLKISLIVAVLAAVTTAPYRFLVLHNWDSTFWACLSVYSAVRWFESFRSGWAFLTGSLAAFTFLSEQSKGAGLILGLALAVVVIAIAKGFPRNLLTLWAGLSWPVAGTLTYFGSRHALRIMFDSWLWPLRHYSVANRVRYGDQNWSDHARDLLFHTGSWEIRLLKAAAVSPGFIIPVLPLIAFTLLFYWGIRLRRTRDVLSTHYVLLCSVLSGLLISVIVVRADIIHFMYLAPLFYLVMAWVLDARDLHGQRFKKLRTGLRLYCIVAFGLMGFALLVAAMGSRNQVVTRRGIIRTREKDSVLDYALGHTVPGRKIFVYPYLPLYYYLTDSENASRYEYFQPGMNTSGQAEEIIRSLRSEDVTTVLFEPGFADKIPNSWPGTPLSKMTQDPIAEYVVRNYRVCAALMSAAGWNFLYMKRGDQGCP